MREAYHEPVMPGEAMTFLDVKPGQWYIDATLGGGGHSRKILEQGGKVIGIDCDQEAIDYVGETLQEKKTQREWQDQETGIGIREYSDIFLVRGNFRHLGKIVELCQIEKISGVLFDLGVSSRQLEKADRGFSFQREGPLDMRMDTSLGVTAADLVNNLSQKELYALFQKFGQDPNSWRVAGSIFRQRRIKPFATTKELSRLIEQVVPRRGKIHPATRIFQALRMAVNTELENIQTGLEQAYETMEQNGRLVVISFHSGEDRVVKHFIEQQQELKTMITLTKKPVQPTTNEQERNPRSRSAKLRAAMKV